MYILNKERLTDLGHYYKNDGFEYCMFEIDFEFEFYSLYNSSENVLANQSVNAMKLVANRKAFCMPNFKRHACFFTKSISHGFSAPSLLNYIQFV